MGSNAQVFSVSVGSRSSYQAPERRAAEEGFQLISRGRCSEAAEILGAAAAGPGASAEVWAHLGMALVGLDRSTEALACFERCLALAPDQDGLWYSLGILHLHAGANGPAFDAFQRALQLQPGMHAARQYACQALYGLGRDAEADALFPDSPERLILKAQALCGQGEYERSMAAYRAAIQRREAGVEPVESAPVRTFTPEGGRKALLAAQKRLDAAGIPFCLFAGTLLGVIRDGDLLPHDKDLDLGVPWDVDRRRAVDTLCAGGEFIVPWAQGIQPTERPWHRSFVHVDTRCVMDLFFLKPEGRSFLCGFDHRPHPVLSRVGAFTLVDRPWNGSTWKVPDPPEAYLEEIYGPGWRTPDPGYDTVLSNPRRCPESRAIVLCLGYLRIHEAVAAGRWRMARRLAQQILTRHEDPFLVGLGARIDSRLEGRTAPGLAT